MSAALKFKPKIVPLLTWEQYEQLEATSEVKHEFVNGQVYAMAGATRNHNRIAGNTFAELHQQLKGKRCEPFISDMKLRIDLNRELFGYYPDVMVVCDPKDKHQLHTTNPTVVFEVLSQSTSRIDRREKLLAYQAVSSLQVYVLLEQTHVQATVYRRSSHWQAETLVGGDAVLDLPEIEASLTLAALYDRVDWDDLEQGTEAA